MDMFRLPNGRGRKRPCFLAVTMPSGAHSIGVAGREKRVREKKKSRSILKVSFNPESYGTERE